MGVMTYWPTSLTKPGFFPAEKTFFSESIRKKVHSFETISLHVIIFCRSMQILQVEEQFEDLFESNVSSTQSLFVKILLKYKTLSELNYRVSDKCQNVLKTLM